MLSVVDASISEIARQGATFKWERPQCPCGSPKVWGHGFVRRIFDGFAAPLLLKRWRCPHCKTIITMTPSGFWPRYQTAVGAIGKAIASRLQHQGWPPGVSRQRAGHWLRSFLRLLQMDFPNEEPLPLLWRLIDGGVRFLV